MKFKELAQKYFPDALPGTANTKLLRTIRKHSGLEEQLKGPGSKKIRVFTSKQVALIKAHLGHLPKGRPSKKSLVPDVGPAKKEEVTGGIKKITIHTGTRDIQLEEKGGKIFIGGVEVETVDPRSLFTKKKDTSAYESIIKILSLMEVERGNCLTLSPVSFPQMKEYKSSTLFGGYCVREYFKKYPNLRAKESFKVKKGLSPDTVRIIRIA